MAAIDKPTLVSYLQSYTGLVQNVIEDYLDYAYNIVDPNQKSYFLTGFAWNMAAGIKYPKRDDMVELLNSYFA